jgi:hypothetical protein
VPRKTSNLIPRETLRYAQGDSTTSVILSEAKNPVLRLQRREGPTFCLIALAAALLLAGCGISLGGGTSSELFSKLSLEGEPVVGSEMTLEVTHEQRYPLPVDISCFLVQPGRSRRLLGRDTLPADPDTSAEPTPVAGASTFRFRVQAPGRYLALCNTPLDPENSISEEFRVK